MDTTSSSSRTSRFRFRDHNHENDMGDEDYESSEADSSSFSSNEDLHLHSMTARGVEHLCSELLELKQQSDEDFHTNIFSNYYAFLQILKELEASKSEILGLKNHACLQKRLIKDVSDVISAQLFSEDPTNSILEELNLLVQPSSPSALEAHTQSVSEILDTLLSEHRLYDAIALLQLENEFLNSLQLGDHSSDQMMFYNSTVSEKRAKLSDTLTMVAKHPRISAPELQKALFGLCQLGDNTLATQLLLQYYHSRIASGLQSSKEFLNVRYVQESSRFVCSMISQAVTSFAALNGDTNYDASSELSQWAVKEIKVVAVCFNKFIESISDISGRLSTAVYALKIAMSYCSLLERLRIFLQPSLTALVRPCTQEVLTLHIDHLSEVVRIFTSTDTWILSRCYAMGVLRVTSYMMIEEQPEYFFLTDSGRKFIILFQSVAEDMWPLVALQMESEVLKGMMELFTSYFIELETAIAVDSNAMEKGVSILANLWTLMQFTSSIIRNIFNGIHHLDCEIDNYTKVVQDYYSRLKTCFLDGFISNIFSTKVEHSSGVDDSRISDIIPSAPYMELYLELKKVEKIGEEECMDNRWLKQLLKEVVEAILEWILSSKSETISKENAGDDQTMQFILDVQFVVEIARQGGYLSDEAIKLSNDIVSGVEASLNCDGLSPAPRCEWAAMALEQLHANITEFGAEEETEVDVEQSLVIHPNYQEEEPSEEGLLPYK